MRWTRWTRWTRSRFAAALTLAILACGKSAARKAAEVRECSAITMDAKGAAQCLVLQHKWKQPAALAAATRYQQEQDSTAQLHADSAWRADAARHTREIGDCAKDPSSDMARCLVGYGWAEARAAATAEPIPKGDYVAIVPLLSRWVGGTELKHLPKLKIIANCAVGHDNVDVVAAEMRRVAVTNTPDVLTDATADLAWALILACARR